MSVEWQALLLFRVLHCDRIGHRLSAIGYRESTQKPTFIPRSIFRAGPAAVGWPKNGEVMTPE